MRFQAMGDMVITLPYLQDLKNQLPAATFHFLTRDEVAMIPQHLSMFDKVISLGGGRNAKIQFVLSLFWLPFLWWQRYDVVIDLQNHRISKILRRLLQPASWSEFDRTSPRSAGDRTRNTINKLKIVDVSPKNQVMVFNAPSVDEKLIDAGWNQTSSLVILNPAGFFSSRNWPGENYVSLAKIIRKKYVNVQFLVLGLPSMETKAQFLKNELGDWLINLTSQTDPLEAYLIVRRASIVISEDSGLMHMGWTQGIPVVAIFGSTRSDWSGPIGKHTVCLNSSDLPCGNCELAVCKYNDNHCLTRFTPEIVFAEVEKLTSFEK